MAPVIADASHAGTYAKGSTPLDVGRVFRDEVAFVARNVRRLGVAEASADDVVQKVFLVVHRRIGELSATAPGETIRIRSWLFQIIRRVVRDERRAAARHPVPTATGELHVIAPMEARPDVAHEHKEAARVLHAMLAEMDEARREVFILAEIEGFSAPEVAGATGTNLNTVYARLRAARQDFERALTRHEAREAHRGGVWTR